MMASETKTVRIEIPAHQGSSIHITSSDSGHTIVTIEQSIEDNDVIKIISSPSKNYDKFSARREHAGLGKTTTHVETTHLVETKSETNLQGHVYVTETKDIRKDVNDSQTVETRSWPRATNYLDYVSILSETPNIKKEENFSQVKCNTSQTVPTNQMKADQSLDERISSETNRPRTRNWSFSERNKNKRVTRSHYREECKDASKSPLSKDVRKVASHLSRDKLKCASRSSLSKVYFKPKSCEIKTEIPKPVIPTVDLYTRERRSLRAHKKFKNTSDLVNRSNMVKTRSKHQRKREHIKRNPNVIGNRKALRKANLGQPKPYLSFRRDKDSSLEKQNLRKPIVQRNEPIESMKRSIVRLCRKKPAKNLNYILFKQRKVFVPNLNIIKRLNMNCKVLLKPIRVVATNIKHLNYKSDLIEELYNTYHNEELYLKTRKDLSNLNKFDSYVHKLVTVLSSTKPKKNSFLDQQKAIHNAPARDENDEDVATLFEEALQKDKCSKVRETKPEVTKSYKESPRCFFNSSESMSLDFKKKFDDIQVGQSNLTVKCTRNESFEEPSQKNVLRPCFVLIGDESRAEFVQRTRVLKYLEVVPRHQKDILETNEQPLRPYLLPYAWELPLHIFEHLRKQNLIKKPKTVTRLLSQYTVTPR